jgi:tetratricopeptide (TPR) repeat protein
MTHETAKAALAAPPRPAGRARLRALAGSRALPLLLLIALGLALRLWLLSLTPLDPRFSNADDGDYYRRALRLAVTGQYLDDSWLIRPPLHVFFFAAWLRLAIALGRPDLGVLLVQLAQIALGVLMIPLGYDLARRLFASRAAGLLFAAFLAVWFPFVEMPTVLFSELIYLFLFLLSFWFMLRFDASGRLRELAGAGLALGAASLTRSPALYSLAFVGLWLWIRRPGGQTSRHPAARILSLKPQASHLIIVAACCLAVVGPWTLRNWLVYQRFIPVDTLGPINLWLDLDAVSRRNEHIATLRALPQADRQAYAMAQVRAILAEDPLRPFRGMWPTFQHIWKAQYIEDYLVKHSFFARPLREAAPLGLFGDALWLAFTAAGLWGLAGPAREGWHNRLFVLAWIGYSLLTVLVFHVEPRYLVPIWTLLALYGAGTLSGGRGRGPGAREAGRQGAGETERRSAGARRVSRIVHPASFILQVSLLAAFVVLFVSYRDYPALLARGLARERAMAAGERAYAAGAYAEAEARFREALAAHPGFTDGQVSLALALAAQGKQNDALATLRPGASRRADTVLGALLRDIGQPDAAAKLLQRGETIAGEDLQRWTLETLHPPPADNLTLGDGLDLGYIDGFSYAERDAARTFRWLEGRGRIVLPLARPLATGATVTLLLAGGQPGGTPLEVRIGGGPAQRALVAGGWRAYHFLAPPALAGQTRLTIDLRAPTFVPMQRDPASTDARALSVMVGKVRVAL